MKSNRWFGRFASSAFFLLRHPTRAHVLGTRRGYDQFSDFNKGLLYHPASVASGPSVPPSCSLCEAPLTLRASTTKLLTPRKGAAHPEKRSSAPRGKEQRTRRILRRSRGTTELRSHTARGRGRRSASVEDDASRAAAHSPNRSRSAEQASPRASGSSRHRRPGKRTTLPRGRGRRLPLTESLARASSPRGRVLQAPEAT